MSGIHLPCAERGLLLSASEEATRGSPPRPITLPSLLSELAGTSGEAAGTSLLLSRSAPGVFPSRPELCRCTGGRRTAEARLHPRARLSAPGRRTAPAAAAPRARPPPPRPRTAPPTAGGPAWRLPQRRGPGPGPGPGSGSGSGPARRPRGQRGGSGHSGRHEWGERPGARCCVPGSSTARRSASRPGRALPARRGVLGARCARSHPPAAAAGARNPPGVAGFEEPCSCPWAGSGAPSLLGVAAEREVSPRPGPGWVVAPWVAPGGGLGAAGPGGCGWGGGVSLPAGRAACPALPCPGGCCLRRGAAVGW